MPDPIDLAIIAGATRHCTDASATRVAFIPFEPATKLSEASVIEDGKSLHVIKGAPHAVAARVGANASSIESDVERMAAQGSQVLAVGVGETDSLRVAGLLALNDPPRVDSRTLIEKLASLGIRVLMITGDGLKTAQALASRVGIDGHSCPEPRCAATWRKRSAVMSSRRSIRKTNSSWSARCSVPAMRLG